MPVADVVQEMVDVVLPGVTVRPEMVGPAAEARRGIIKKTVKKAIIMMGIPLFRSIY